MERWPWIVLAGWTAATFAIVLLRDGLSADNLTHLGILAFGGAQLVLGRPLRSLAARCRPGRFFVVMAVACALVVEGCYMISAPLHPSLLVTAQMGAGAALRNYGVDVLLVTPAYVGIFGVVWWLVRRYDYAAWEVAVFIAGGQALGDGQAFFVTHPGLLVFFPYVLVNYQAMTLIAYRSVRPDLVARRQSRWVRCLLPLLLLPATYFVCGAVVLSAGHWLGFF